MFSKQERKEINTAFWDGFKTYCKRKGIKGRWILKNTGIRYVQLKFFADHKKALVLIEINSSDEDKRHLIYSYFYAIKNLWQQEVGADLKWEKDFDSIGNYTISAVYFQLNCVNMYKEEDKEQIYSFMAEKMIVLEKIFLEYSDMFKYQLSEIV